MRGPQKRVQLLEAILDKWQKDSKLTGSKNFVKVIETILIYLVVFIARHSKDSFEIGGDVYGGVKDGEDEIFSFQFSVKQSSGPKEIEAPKVLN